MLSLILSPSVEPIYPTLERDDGLCLGDSFFPLQRELSILPDIDMLPPPVRAPKHHTGNGCLPPFGMQTPSPSASVMLPPPLRRSDSSTIVCARRSLFNARETYDSPNTSKRSQDLPIALLCAPAKKPRIANGRARPLIPCADCGTTFPSNKTLKKGICKNGKNHCRLACSDPLINLDGIDIIERKEIMLCTNMCGNPTNGSSQLCSRSCLIQRDESDIVDITGMDLEEKAEETITTLLDKTHVVNDAFKVIALHPQHGCLAAVSELMLLRHAVSRLRDMVEALAKGQEDFMNMSGDHIMMVCPVCMRLIDVAHLLPTSLAGGFLMNILDNKKFN